uniref:uncharacterized protein LOC131137429 n=1 Tax=Doryrhamphus excisus TaxID=161450 RepID=UPI0025AE8BC1|nr:uncharacterized protein LOC131137429 [Doryrhamphus excisus]XP_057941376.1 uncharacterized protein LOC131137429 [Doryrhamphus excisus]XP_057941377.1 uncharacterized protein LOC131137429 [Doryrhamphus excisus]XP_057941379.1 uncharacterized protein LOC131137429 [Doryrhamphus excisus]XP_057941380.1 uncharacterized protein LOC131137429 [Doryrhamphus excisus]XP_057941381.1 uncharacterized protein LOC131137429 [Doryrhamphus excisus]XP_057941382.1 uncharacterized protein LOC131137429 [Doryrhamphus
MSSPPIKKLMELWPALCMLSEVYAEFQHITNQNLPNTFYAELDRHTPCLMALFRQKASRTGKTADVLANILKVHDTQESQDVHTRRVTILHVLPVYLREEVSGFFRTCVIKGTAMGKRFSPSYANIFMAKWEDEVFVKCPRKTLKYLRHRNDIWGIWTDAQEEFREFLEQEPFQNLLLSTLLHRNILKMTDLVEVGQSNTVTFVEFYESHADRKDFLKDSEVRLPAFSSKGMSRASIQENSLANPAKFNLLQQDQPFVLRLLSKAIKAADISDYSTLSKFGQKSNEAQDLAALLNMDHIVSIIGDRGALYTALSVGETANFHTNLHGQAPDVSGQLLNMLFKGEEDRGALNFLQLDTDSPHTHQIVIQTSSERGYYNLWPSPP